MSGILKNGNIRRIKRKVFNYKSLYIFLCVLLMSVSIALAISGAYILLLLCIVLLMLVCFNVLVVLKIKQPVKVFGERSRVRNVDYLVIGDMCEVDEVILNLDEQGKNREKEITYVQLSAPERTLFSSYEILRHTYSILKETGGKVILVVKRKNVEKQKLSIFDMPIFLLSPTTVKRLRLESLKIRSYFPLFVSPLKSIRLFFCSEMGGNVMEGDNSKKVLGVKYHRVDCPNKDIAVFCDERGMTLEVWSDC